MVQRRKFQVGDLVRVDSDNDCYSSWKHRTLKIVKASYSVSEHPGYDKGMEPQEGLFDFEFMDGTPCPCSLYEYEIELLRRH